MRSLILPLIMLVSTTLASISIVVADPYVGLGIGSAFYKADLTGLGGGNLDDNSTGSKLYGGYTFNNYFSAEAAIYNFAEASVGEFDFNGRPVSAAIEMKGIGAYAVAMYPVSKKVNLLAKLGVLSWDADLRVNNTNGTNDGTDVAFALAASYGFTRELLAIAEWESFDSDNPELSMLSVGFKFIFK